MSPKVLLMQANTKKLKHDLEKYSKIIRNKYMMLKRGKFAIGHVVQETLNPIISPLNQLASHKNEPVQKQIINQDTQTSDLVTQDVQTSTDTEPIDYTLKAPLTDLVTQPESPSEGAKKLMDTVLTYDDELSDDVISYVALLHQKPKRGIDTTYGVRYENNKYKIGNMPIYFKPNNVVEVGDKENKVSYKGSIGLYELLFKHQPTYYNDEDLIKYKDILYKTSAHKLDYNPNKALNINRSNKYKSIISQLFFTKSGRGFYAWKQAHPITHKVDYKYWDDPNELVNRLYLLIASRDAGHTGHENEIKEILQELRDSKYIQ